MVARCMKKDPDAATLIAKSEKMVDDIHAILAGQSPEVVGATLAECFARLIAGHAPPIRDAAQAEFFKLAVDLVPVIIGELTATGRYPAEWVEQDAALAAARKDGKR
jgi:hypothetical protein